MTERWLPVVGWEGLYEVSDQGRVRSLDRTVEMANCCFGKIKQRFTPGKILSQCDGRGKGRGWKGSGNYRAVNLSSQDLGRKKLMVHRLVLAAFVGPPPEGRRSDGAHTDGNTLNNELGNLRWASRRDNMADMPKQGRKIEGQGLFSPFSHTLALAVAEAYAAGASFRDLQAQFGLKQSVLVRMCADKEYMLRNFGIAIPNATKGRTLRTVYNALRDVSTIDSQALAAVATAFPVPARGCRDRRYERVLESARDLESKGLLKLVGIAARRRASRIAHGQLAEMRAAKAGGRRLFDIAQEHGLSLSYASKLITGKKYSYSKSCAA